MVHLKALSHKIFNLFLVLEIKSVLFIWVLIFLSFYCRSTLNIYVTSHIALEFSYIFVTSSSGDPEMGVPNRCFKGKLEQQTAFLGSWGIYVLYTNTQDLVAPMQL